MCVSIKNTHKIKHQPRTPPRILCKRVGQGPGKMRNQKRRESTSRSLLSGGCPPFPLPTPAGQRTHWSQIPQCSLLSDWGVPGVPEAHSAVLLGGPLQIPCSPHFLQGGSSQREEGRSPEGVSSECGPLTSAGPQGAPQDPSDGLGFLPAEFAFLWCLIFSLENISIRPRTRKR